MQISIVTIGSRGDVQPFVSLGLGLQRAGHGVRIATHELFRDFVTSHGLEFSPVAGNPEELLKSDVGQQMMSSEKKFEAIKAYLKMLEPLAIPCAEDVLAGCRDADLIICMESAYMYGEATAEHLKKPIIFVGLCPHAPSRYLPGPLASPWPKWLEKIDLLGGHWYHQKFILDLKAFIFRKQTNRYRKEVFNLPPRSSRWGMKTFSEKGDTWLYGYSPHVAAKPKDWSSRQHVVGWWFLDDAKAWQPPADLTDFLAAGPPPIYVGFGSMFTPDRERLANTIVEALQKSGQRGLLAKGWGLIDPQNVPANCHLLETAPHDWLFPRMAAVIHHGGAGTTGAGARAGVPNLVVPFAYDQPFWGRSLNRAGGGPPPIPAKELTVDNLAAAMTQMVESSELKASAANLGAKIRAEDGVARAVEIIEREMGSPKH